MEPTSHHSPGSAAGSTAGAYDTTHSDSASSVSSTSSIKAGYATGTTLPAADAPAQPTSGVKAKLDSALESGKKWLDDSGVAEQAQQLPQKAKELGNQAWASISGLTTTQKAIGVGILAAGIAFLATRGKGKKQAPEFRDRPRKSPFDHQPHTKDGDHAYDRRGQRPYGNSRYGTASAPANKPRVTSGSGYTSAPSAHSADFGRAASSDRAGSAPGSGQRRDQGPASGTKYDATKGGSQNPNNADQLTSAY